MDACDREPIHIREPRLDVGTSCPHHAAFFTRSRTRMPEDVITDMKRIAPLRGFSGYQTSMRSYVSAGIREDLERFEGSAIGKLIERLRESGVPEKTLIKAASDVAKRDG